MKNLIMLTGKEQKKDLIQLILQANPYFENRNSLRDKEVYLKSDSKSELLKHIKILNANFAAGGDGNISSFYNHEAHSHKIELDERIKAYLSEIGVNENTVKDHVPLFKDRLEMENKWKDFLEKECNGFIGHTNEEKNMAFEFLKNLWDQAINKNKTKI